MTAQRIYDIPLSTAMPSSFEDWRARLDREQVTPVIAIAGSRGKTSVLRAIEAILGTGGYRFASWTDRGVEIEGARQRGELGPWSRALTRLAAGGLDVALHELDWATVHTVAAGSAPYPVVAVANLCANSEACLVTPETLLARKALRRIQSSVSPAGRLIVNADDFAVSDSDADDAGDRYLVGISADTPILRRHLDFGGNACWVEHGVITTREGGLTIPVVDTGRLGWTQRGHVPFAVHNALMATAIARSCGLPHRLIATGLAAHDARPESMPGSFNVFDTGSATIVVDRPVDPWFLRSSLRAVGNLGAGRQLRVAGPMLEITTEELTEVGRLLGRNGGVLITHGDWEPERFEAFRHGAGSNEVPPIVLHAPQERAAVQQAMAMLRPDDVLLVLAENAPATVRLIAKRLRQRATAAIAAGQR
jgi:UDP-N-acetylmuramyl pentapeptide synthase